LQAVKLIYLTTHRGIPLADQSAEENGIYRHLTVGDAEHLYKLRAGELPPELRSKLDQAARAVRGGVPRVHIIDGREEEGLLAEVFSNEGIGTLIHANEYENIRPADKRDVRAIYNLIQAGVERDELVQRSREDIESQINDFFVFEVDRNPVACVALHLYPEDDRAELACLCVDPRCAKQGVGVKLMQYVEKQARAMDVGILFCLSTQAYKFFEQKGGFVPGTPDDLPPDRRERYERSGRQSRVLLKRLD
jgi:amino-acid N-acetyltransferase